MSLNGIINVLKPPGMSSHQVVSRLRRTLNTKRIGHTGTLDPGASGVLSLCVGHATKLASYLMDKDKSYVGEITLGVSTDTQDAGGKTLQMRTDFLVSPQQLADVLHQFIGTQHQVPPMASAVKHKGRRLYQYHRQGEEVHRPARPIKIESIHVNKIWPDDQHIHFGARILLQVTCSKGTYIRTLCHDIGEALGTYGHMSFLSRIRNGYFSIEESYLLQEIERMYAAGDTTFCLDPQAGLPDWPRFTVDRVAATKICNGNRIPLQDVQASVPNLAPADIGLVVDGSGNLLAVAEVHPGPDKEQLYCQPKRVLCGGEGT